MIDKTDDAILEEWYRHAAQQPGSVESLLALLRSRQAKSPEQQRIEVGASEPEFLRLQAMRLPRPHLFASDAQRMAVACHLTNPIRFVHELLLARNLARATDVSGPVESYQAAFDAAGDLDESPGEE